MGIYRNGQSVLISLNQLALWLGGSEERRERNNRRHCDLLQQSQTILLTIQIIVQLLQMGAGALCCPPALEPPTPEHAKCKKILKILALALIPVTGLALVAEDSFQLFISLFLVFFLFIGWRMFNWCTILIFFMYSIMQMAQSAIGIAGYIEYDRLFRSKYLVYSIYLIVIEIYYIFAIIASHYVYRVFKKHSNANGLIFNDNPPPPEAPQNQGQYQMLREQNRGNNQGYFQGEGVRIN